MEYRSYNYVKSKNTGGKALPPEENNYVTIEHREDPRELIIT